jgi:hypothetical protein
VRHWLTAERADPEAFAAEVQEVCDLYQRAPALHAQGVHVVSADEKTGMQALERARPTLALKPGLPERREFEYVRHGALCLIANLEVATGRILAPRIGPTRTEEDFAAHIAAMVAFDPGGEWVFVVDNLDTHQSESLVRFVAEAIDYSGDLGKKFKRGILLVCQDPRRLPERPHAPAQVRLHAETLLLAQPDRNLLQRDRQTRLEAWLFRLAR